MRWFVCALLVVGWGCGTVTQEPAAEEPPPQLSELPPAPVQRTPAAPRWRSPMEIDPRIRWVVPLPLGYFPLAMDATSSGELNVLAGRRDPGNLAPQHFLLVRFDEAGAVRWATEVPAAMTWRPFWVRSRNDGGAYVGSAQLVSVGPDGRVQWTSPTGGVAGIAVYPDDSVIIAERTDCTGDWCSPGRVARYQRTGELIWAFEEKNGHYFRDLVLDSSGLAYLHRSPSTTDGAAADLVVIDPRGVRTERVLPFNETFIGFSQGALWSWAWPGQPFAWGDQLVPAATNDKFLLVRSNDGADDRAIAWQAHSFARATSDDVFIGSNVARDGCEAPELVALFVDGTAVAEPRLPPAACPDFQGRLSPAMESFAVSGSALFVGGGTNTLFPPEELMYGPDDLRGYVMRIDRRSAPPFPSR